MNDRAKRLKAERNRKYREENRDKIRETKAKWRKENPDKVRAQQKRYWERKANELAMEEDNADIVKGWERQRQELKGCIDL